MPKLILASQSPRRASLLREAGYAFEQINPPYEDPPQPVGDDRFDPQTLATELASRKAMSLFEAFPEQLPAHIEPPIELVIIGADTICVGVDGSLIGQPRDEAHAREMIRSFTNATHDVVSGVTLLRIALSHATKDSDQVQVELTNMIRFADLVPVTIGSIDDATLNAYLATGQWQGKAGGYNLFDRQAEGWPITLAAIDDTPPDPTTVVGLPMRKLVDMFDAWNIHAIRKSRPTFP